jgi:thioredoxin 1
MATNALDVTDVSFEAEVLKSRIPVLVDFWAEWCGPCKAIAPTLEAVAKDYQGRAKVVKINVDQNIAVPSRYNIKGIPTLLLFRDGVVRDQIVGTSTRENIAKVIDKHL